MAEEGTEATGAAWTCLLPLPVEGTELGPWGRIAACCCAALRASWCPCVPRLQEPGAAFPGWMASVLTVWDRCPGHRHLSARCACLC